jgi:hypothetical protein
MNTVQSQRGVAACFRSDIPLDANSTLSSRSHMWDSWKCFLLGVMPPDRQIGRKNFHLNLTRADL